MLPYFYPRFNYNPSLTLTNPEQYESKNYFFLITKKKKIKPENQTILGCSHVIDKKAFVSPSHIGSHMS